MLIDAIFALLLVLACIKGYRKGLIVALFSVIAFIAGLAAALKLSAVVADRLSTSITASGKWLPVISFISVFLIVVLLVNLAGNMIQKSVEAIMLGWVNRLGGIIIYLLIYSIIFSVFLFYAEQLHFIKAETIDESKSYALMQPLGPAVIDNLGRILPFFRDMFTQLEDFFEKVSDKI
ncbi:MAG: CvpA family protein [Bacteroidetes bacterium]|jgi:membrane protein required for colicin V production|nr:CvpA family protein [Bacteroidota bacterium]